MERERGAEERKSLPVAGICWKSIMSDRIGLFAGPEVKMAGDEEMFPPTAMALEPRGFPWGPDRGGAP